MKKYGVTNNVLPLNLLPIEQRVQMNIEKLVFKSLRYADSPPRLKLYF